MITHVKTRVSSCFFALGASCALLAWCAMSLAYPAIAGAATWTPGNNGGDGTTWDTTAANWSGTPAWTAGTDNAVFAADGDNATIPNSTTVVPTNTGTGITFSGIASVNDSGAGTVGTIGFVTTASTLTIDVDATKTGTINAGFIGVGATGGQGNKINKIGTGKLTLTGNTILVGDVNQNLDAGFDVGGGGELQIDGPLKAASGLQSNRGNKHNRVGDTTNDNVLRIAGAANTTVYAGGLVIGNTGNNNSAYITRPGDITNPSYLQAGNGQHLLVGHNSDDNYLEISNGAYYRTTQGGGTVGTRIGVRSGADNNQVLVTGSGTVMNVTAGSIVVGSEGSGNNVTVSNGGAVLTPRWILSGSTSNNPVDPGTFNGTGDNNSVLITGTGSSTTINAGGNSWFELGELAGANGNSFEVAAGGAFNYTGTGTSRRFSVGNAGDNNYLSVTGASSTVNVNTTGGIPVGVGGLATGAGSMTDGGTGNHLDVFDGGAMTASASAIVMGTNSAINIGDGAAVATLSVGATPSFASGVFLRNASGRLNFDNGRLTGTAGGTLVSGLGEVVLNGDGYFQNSSTNSITTLISGGGGLIKEGIGTLELTQANTYTGDTQVLGGTLQLDQIFLDDASSLYLFSSGSGKMNLNFAGIDTISKLFFDGVQQAAGTWGNSSSAAANQNDTFFDDIITGPYGVGVLNVLEGSGAEVVPEPSTWALAMLGLMGLGMAAWRRRKCAGRE